MSNLVAPPLLDWHVWHLALDPQRCPLGHSHISLKQLVISQCEFVCDYQHVCVYMCVSVWLCLRGCITKCVYMCTAISEHVRVHSKL